MADQISYTKVAQNKGKPRIWIEGVKLSAAGFVKGSQYSICDLADQVLELELDPNGKRQVSGRKRNEKDIPIIDLAMGWLGKKFEGVDRLRVVFSQGRIRITPHHEDVAKSEREAKLKQNLKAGKVTKGTLCVGGAVSASALAEAAQEQGFKTEMAWVVDMDLRYLQSAAKNSPAIDDDTTFILGKLEEVEECYYTDVDVLSVSLPCSGFSIAGKSKHKKSSIEHEGACSMFGLMRAIHGSNPAVIASENVVEAQDSAIYQLITAELERTGYRVFHQILEPEHTSTFEKRRRYWFVAISEGLADGFDFSLPEIKPQEVLLSELLDVTVAEEMWCENEYLKTKAVSDKKASKGFARQLMTGDETSCGTIGRHYAKKRSTEPFLTRADGKERLFTKAEHARVKSVPEHLVAGVPTTTAHQILGQSIDYLQGLWVGFLIFSHLKEKHCVKQKPQYQLR